MQFNTNEVWAVSKLENDKFAHNMLLYFDRAIKNYYDSRKDIALATEDIKTCETYVAKPKYDFPNELQSEINYMNLALKNKLLKKMKIALLTFQMTTYLQMYFKKQKHWMLNM